VNTKSIRTEKISFKKTLFLKIKYYPAEMSHRIDINTMISISIRRLIDDHFLLDD